MLKKVIEKATEKRSYAEILSMERVPDAKQGSICQIAITNLEGPALARCMNFMKDATKRFAKGEVTKEELNLLKQNLLQDLRKEKTTGSKRKSEGDAEEPSIKKRPAATDSEAD